MQRFLLLGTDTDVGKTLVAAALCRAHLRIGKRVVACKPVETGNPAESDLDVVVRLCTAGRRPDLLRTVAGMRFSLAAAPTAAARAQGAPPLSAAQFAAVARSAEAGADAVVVEGCGGALTPLSDSDFVADSAALLAEYRLLLVAGLKLGVLGHVFAVAHYLRSIGRDEFDVVLCDRFGPSPAWYVDSTKDDLARRRLRVSAVVPHFAEMNIDSLADCVAALVKHPAAT